MKQKIPLLKFLRNSAAAALAAVVFLVHATAYAAAKPETLKKSSSYKVSQAKVVKKIALPKWYHEGLFADGKNVWVCNGENGKIWIIDTESGELKSTIEPIATFTEAVTRSPDGTYFTTDWEQHMIYKASIVGSRMEPSSWVSIKPAFPAGIIWIDGKLYCIAWLRGWRGTTFNLLELDEKFVLLRTISMKNIQEPAHLAWDGKNLWIASWYNPLVYKIDVATWQIVGAFKSPAKKTTGIAWDGSAFWVTGTYSDLYKVEVAN